MSMWQRQKAIAIILGFWLILDNNKSYFRNQPSNDENGITNFESSINKVKGIMNS